MVRAIIVESASLWTWWLQLDTPGRCDVLVRGIGAYPNKAACRAAVHKATEAVEADPLAVLSVQTPDGHWHLRFHDIDGRQIATSANRFPTARASRVEIRRLLQAFTVSSVVVAPLAHRRARQQSDLSYAAACGHPEPCGR